LRSSYDAIVIGSGFGGSVATCRLAQAGLSVVVIERGRRYDRNSFPRNWDNIVDGWLWSHAQGLFDVRPFEQMTIVQCAGLGGGSLIYANVHMRAPQEVFASGWPKGYSRNALDPYYDLVAYMLDINPITKSSHLGMPAKTTLMQSVANSLNRAEQFCFPNIAVNFGTPHVRKPNKFGVDQEGCNYCGECDIGCNYHAKNTLDLNYLTLASKHGAELVTQCEAVDIQPVSDGYLVRGKDRAGGDQLCEARARYVFICGGAINSTELLLRCRDLNRSLPKLSDQLGKGYSGNGDFLAFAFNTNQPFKPAEGPTITTGIVYSREDGGIPHWFIFEEGGYPKEIGALLQILNPRRGLMRETEILTLDTIHELFRSQGSGKLGLPDPDAARTAIFLAMGRDLSNGAIELHPVSHQLKVVWNTASNLPLYDTQRRFADDVANALGGNMEMNPLWHLLHVPVSVHNLGGCLMADSADAGVVDPTGEVYGYPGLFVLDGAILPKATGVNPSHTIAAIAERNMENAIRKVTGNSSWRAPENRAVTPVIEPVSSITIPPGGTSPTKTQSIGISFTETMKGHIVRGWTPPDDYNGAERAGQKADSRIQFTLTITIVDLEAFLVNERYPGLAVGTLTAHGFTPDTGVPVTNGVFNLFVSGDEFYQRRMLYALPFTGVDGKAYLLDGFKDVRDHGHFDVWAATSTLYTVIRDGHSRTGPVLASGIMTIHIPDFLRQLTTFTATGTKSSIEKVTALERFGKKFFGTLWDVFVRPHLE
jgi:cholesterol oxidase